MANDFIDKKDETRAANRAAIEAARDFIEEHSRKTDFGASLTRAQFYDYMEKNEGLSRKVVDSVEQGKAHFLGGCDAWNTKHIADTLESKDLDDRELSVTSRVYVQTPSGVLNVTNTGGRVHNVPVRPGEEPDGEKRTTVRYNPCTINWKQNLHLDKDLRVELEDQIRALYDIDE